MLHSSVYYIRQSVLRGNIYFVLAYCYVWNELANNFCSYFGRLFTSLVFSFRYAKYSDTFSAAILLEVIYGFFEQYFFFFYFSY